MSRKVPMSTSEKIKLILAILFCLLIMFPLLRFGVKELYRLIVRDMDGYEKAIEANAERYNFKVVVYREGINSYNLEVNASFWRNLTNDQRKKYCEDCRSLLYNIQQKYKIQEKDNVPSVFFYINGSLYADITNYGVTIY